MCLGYSKDGTKCTRNYWIRSNGFCTQHQFQATNYYFHHFLNEIPEMSEKRLIDLIADSKNVGDYKVDYSSRFDNSFKLITRFLIPLHILFVILPIIILIFLIEQPPPQQQFLISYLIMIPITFLPFFVILFSMREDFKKMLN